MTRRPTSSSTDAGFTMVATMIVLSIVLLLAGTAIAVAVSGLQRATPARDSEKAQAAADAGADIAGYRMSKTLIAPESDGLLGLATGTLRTLGCVGVQMNDASTTSIPAQPATTATVSTPLATLSTTTAGVQVAPISAGNNFCQMTTEQPLSDGESYRYAISTTITLPSTVAASTSIPAGQLIVRQVSAIGHAGHTYRRVIVSYWLNLSTPTHPFVRRHYTRCPPLPAGATDPFASCPTNPGY
ncbi:hypothetical protein NBH00_11420 [Paraconexibacter antarcticus]|uniref:Flp pilus-assembly TadG-like N-terminal domain-containing protein n=1 Tax=Paraconexibacter antarcticus TaxID=2949664 RepID=A0ABY5DRR7_9ACTN|nr:hypothetical protein [Paraconexibacter antarcticus]UTI64361.1 hypothetical protein NBH00_23860 [Paraconexibacter antarcticus]UTI66791.1 hypothetical protein NBH00_11420 [Paraconexibacter antarcticus]